MGRRDQGNINWKYDDGNAQDQDRVGQDRSIRLVLDHHMAPSSQVNRTVSEKFRYQTWTMNIKPTLYLKILIPHQNSEFPVSPVTDNLWLILLFFMNTIIDKVKERN